MFSQTPASATIAIWQSGTNLRIQAAELARFETLLSSWATDGCYRLDAKTTIQR